MRINGLSCCVLWLVLTGNAVCAAEEEKTAGYRVPLVEGKPYIHVVHDGISVRVERIQDPDFELRGYYAKTARNCPPFCIHPMDVAPGVATIGEVEMFQFLEIDLRDGKGVLIDARTPTWYEKGTIPGSINRPFTLFSNPLEDSEWDNLLPSFGAKPSKPLGLVDKTLETLGLVEEGKRHGKWDFSQAKKLVFFCNGPACDQSPRAIMGLLTVGYPPEKLMYYRGGMQMWELWGLTTVKPVK